MLDFYCMLLSDFHIHTNFSDGQHSMTEIVDFYGRSGFKAIAITDHLCEQKTFLGQAAQLLSRTLTPENFPQYIETIYCEAERARSLYGMTVIPGIEITKNSFKHKDSAHILALGVDQYIDPDQSISMLIADIHSHGGLAIAAHPVSTKKLESQTYYLWQNREEFAQDFDAWEVASGPYLFEEVSQSKLPLLANSDLHHKSQMKSWKTLVHSRNESASILEAIKRQNLDFIFYQGGAH